jgi:hypothetical protein
MIVNPPHTRTAAGAPGTDLALVRPARNVVGVRQGHRTVLLDADRGQFYGLDGVAGRFWEMLENGTDLPEIEAQIEREYDVPRERIAQDLRALVEQLRQRGLLS